MPNCNRELQYIYSLANPERDGLVDIKYARSVDELKKLVKKLGDPQGNIPSVHISGTKGKGSTSSFIAGILTAHGYRTGLYTSPHIYRQNERIKINTRSITDPELATNLKYILDHIKELKTHPLSYFELLTFIAFLHFKKEKADYAVFETGLGGRLDATNVILPRTSCITPVSYDHMHLLGRTIEKITAEKAAIIKEGTTCVSAKQRTKALEVIKKRCGEMSCELRVLGKDVKYKIYSSDETGSVFDVSTRYGTYKKCRTRMPGEFQVANATLAVASVENALNGIELDERCVIKGLEETFLPCRCELIGRSPKIVLDGAQNGDSARSLVQTINGTFKFRRLISILGLSAEKDIKSVCEALAPISRAVVITRSLSPRAANPELIRGYINKVISKSSARGKVILTYDIKEALGHAFRISHKDDLILITGSFYLTAEARRLLCKGHRA